MPIYEYSCTSCHHVFEEWTRQVVDEQGTAACPFCGGVGKKIMSQTSFALKGGGWYVTEYGSKKDDAEKKTSSDSVGPSQEEASKGASVQGEGKPPQASAGGSETSSAKGEGAKEPSRIQGTANSSVQTNSNPVVKKDTLA